MTTQQPEQALDELAFELDACRQELTRQRQKCDELTANAHGLIAVQSKLQALLHHASEGMIILNADGTVQSFNRAAERIFKCSEIELLYRPLGHLFPGAESFPGTIQDYLRTIAHTKDSEVYYGRRADGNYVPLRIALNEVMNSDLILFSDEEVSAVEASNDLNWTLCVVQDITQELMIQDGLRKQAGALEALNKAMRQANALKSYFMSNVGHELRTPINGILGIARLLEERELSPDTIELVTAIKQSGVRLQGLIEDVLRVTEDADNKVEHVPVHLVELMTRVTETWQYRIVAKGLSFQSHIDSGVPEYIVTDRNRLQTAMDKLLDNAVKFCDQGMVSVITRVEDNASTDAANLLVSISDSGIGIAQDDLDNLATPFYQVDMTHARRAGGFGLGLAVVRQSLEAIGARLDVKSQPGAGSTFTIVLPLRTAEQSLRIQEGICDREKLMQLRVTAGGAFNDVADQFVLELRKQSATLTAATSRDAVLAALRELDTLIQLIGAKELRRVCDVFIAQFEQGDDGRMQALKLDLDTAVARVAEVLSPAAGLVV